MPQRTAAALITAFLLMGVLHTDHLAAAEGGGSLFVGKLAVNRPGHSTTLLKDGSVLVAGGGDGEASAERYDLTEKTWRPTEAMTESRGHHTATLLNDGRVLVTGGGGSNGALASAEVFDPATSIWRATAPMALARLFHSATLLLDGRVLVAGGEADGHGPYHREAEIYDPVAGSWSPGGAMGLGRSLHTATLLSDGSVLVTGGQGAAHDFSLRDAAVYQSGTNSWAPVPRLMAAGRAAHTATLLRDGRVLIVGGTTRRQGGDGPKDGQSSVEIYDPTTGSFRRASSMAEPRVFHSAVALPSGRVAVTRRMTREVELFDPARVRWTKLSPLAKGLDENRHTATLLTGPRCGEACGMILVIGERSVQLYAPPRQDVVGLVNESTDGQDRSVLPIIGIGLVLAVATKFLFVRKRQNHRTVRPAGRRSDATSSATAPKSRGDHRLAAAVTDQQAQPVKSPGRFARRRSGATAVGATRAARSEAEAVLAALDNSIAALREGLSPLADLRRPRLLGKVEEGQARVDRAAAKLTEARQALAAGELADCGRAAIAVQRELDVLGGPLSLALSRELAQAAISRERIAALEANRADQARAKELQRQAQEETVRAGLLALTPVYRAMAEGWSATAKVLADQGTPAAAKRKVSGSADDARIVAPHELESFADVGGLGEAKEQLRRTIGLVLERGAEAAESGIVHNGILLYGPPGTGKTLLARALAGEYGLRFLRFSPALIASGVQHEPARKLRQIFALAAASAPCLLLLDEVDSIGGRREDMSSADQRELATQLLNSLEEYRDVPGLVIMAATNALDHLDPALREGRFDSRISVALPDADARSQILRVQLERCHDRVDWDGLDLDEVVRRSAGRSGAALAAIVNGAMERALVHGGQVGHADLVAEIDGRSGRDRAQTLQHAVTWDDVVLPEATRQRLAEILLLFQQPELGESLGVRAPAGILLFGPPGTGKTTVAKALATEVRASFYEHSAADLLSKWVGESEQRVARLFSRARENRPSIIFIDEIDALLKRRSADSSAPWEERVVSQFLGELDGLHGAEGVLLVGSTNRPDMIDDAVRDRRLVAIEVPLPDTSGREQILTGLCRSVRLAPGVDLVAIAACTEGMSGADLKAVRDGAGMKALARAASSGETADVMVTRGDFSAVLLERGLSLGRSRTSTANPGSSTARPGGTRRRSAR